MCLQTPLRLACDLMNSFQWLCTSSSRFCREMTLAVLSLHLPPRLSDGGLENSPEGHLVHVAAPWGPQEGGAIQVDQEYPPLSHPEQVHVESQECPPYSVYRAVCQFPEISRENKRVFILRNQKP